MYMRAHSHMYSTLALWMLCDCLCQERDYMHTASIHTTLSLQNCSLPELGVCSTRKSNRAMFRVLIQRKIKVPGNADAQGRAKHRVGILSVKMALVTCTHCKVFLGFRASLMLHALLTIRHPQQHANLTACTKPCHQTNNHLSYLATLTCSLRKQPCANTHSLIALASCPSHTWSKSQI